jgi:hypothetical protein
MSDSTLAELQKELEQLDASYQDGYAGKDRTTVDPGGLVELASRAKRALDRVDALGALTAGEEVTKLRAELAQRADLYERERRMVAAAKEMGPSFERFGIEGAAANFVFDRYNRHFAGQSRDTRDHGLIKELVEELKGVKKRMLAIGGKKLPDAMQADVDLVQSNIERYQVEEREIPKAQATGTPEEQADRWAFLANQQFALYATHFAGKSRLTRRPALLVRMVDNLKRYRAGMFDLKNRGLDSASNANNIGIVDGRIQAYDKELAEIRKVRSGVKLVDIMGALGNAANELFAEYRDNYAGKDRTGVDLARLGLMLDQLDEIRRQMEELGRVEKNEVNTKNAAVVREYQVNWVREWQAVRTAQQGTSA